MDTIAVVRCSGFRHVAGGSLLLFKENFTDLAREI